VKRIRGISLVVYAVLVVFLAVLFPGFGWSQQEQQKQKIVSGEFNISQEIHWENSVLPMGDYIYYVESNRWPLVVRVEQKDGSFSGMFVPFIFLRPNQQGKSGIALAHVGSDTYVKALNLPDGQGELSFTIPDSEEEDQPAETARTKDTPAALARAAEYLTIFNPNRDKISIEEVEKVYLGACEAVEKEYHRPAPIRPRLILRLGTESNVLRFPMREILLKKWDEYRFADAVVALALNDMVSREDRARLTNTAVKAAGTTVSVCELKACVN
jgi:hypothetical protein